MAESPKAEPPVAEAADQSSCSTTCSDGEGPVPLKMSFADWKKCKEALKKPEQPGEQQTICRQQRNISGSPNGNQNASFAPISMPPPLPLPLMSLSFPNYGPPPPPQRRNRPLQPPPFWEDMMSPQHMPQPMQPVMPKCPSLWNLVPKDKPNNGYAQNRHKKRKPFISNQNKSTNVGNEDAALMPPPSTPSSSNLQQQPNVTPPLKKVKMKGGGVFVQVDGRWLKKPEAPPPLDFNSPGTKEERQRQWKEYRQAMKPFKNREFHNWKRTVQRLSKIPRDQLDERDLERLQKAEEYIGAHKAMLSIKHAERWVPQENQTSQQGQIFVRSKPPTPWEKNRPEVKNYVGMGRAIKGGVSTDINTASIPPPPPPSRPFPPQSIHQQQPVDNMQLSNCYLRPDYINLAGIFSQEQTQSNASLYSSHFVKGDVLQS